MPMVASTVPLAASTVPLAASTVPTVASTVPMVASSGPIDPLDAAVAAGPVGADLFAAWSVLIVGLVLLLLFVGVRSVRLVLPAERLVIRHSDGVRVAGPGLRFVRPFAAQAQAVPARIVTRDVGARSVDTRDGARPWISVRMTVLVAPNRRLRDTERDIDVCTRRVLRTLASDRSWVELSAGAADAEDRLRQGVAAALARRGHALVALTPEWPQVPGPTGPV